jgi:MFS family permease
VFGAVALALLVLRETDSALATTALFLCAKALPAFAAPALTAAVDQRPAHRVLTAIYLTEVVVFAALAGLASSFWLPAVLALAYVDGVLALTARGLTRGLSAAVLGPDHLRAGNALLNVAYAVGTAAAPPIAGLVAHEAGFAAALWIDAGSFALAALLVGVGVRGRVARVATERERWRARLADGLAYVRGNAAARRLVAGEAVAIIFFTMAVPIEVVFVQRTLDSTSLGYGALLGSWGLGVIAGSVIFARTKGHLQALIVLATAVVGVSYLGIAAAPNLLVACLAGVVGGVGNGIQWVSVMTALQEAVEDAFQARAAGLLESVGAIAPGIGFVAGGLLTVAASPRLALAVGGVGALAVAAVWARYPLVRERVAAGA